MSADGDVRDGAVRLEVDPDGIAWLTIDNPRRRNALTYPMMAELFRGLRDAAAGGARVVVLIGAGDHFCSGIDLAHLDAIPPEARGYQGALTDSSGLWNVTACPLPVIAAVDGAAVGMGAELTSHADVRIATSRARFAWSFVRRGLVPDTGAGTWLLPRQIGVQEALRLVLSGDWLDAEEALRRGYVAAVVPPDDLRDAVRAEARRFLAGAPQAQRATKRLLYEGLSRGVAEHNEVSRAELLERFRSEEHAEGVAAFLDGREPRFGPAG